MTGLEAIPKLTELLTKLIKGAKDRETQLLVQEIQAHQFVIQTALMEANAKLLKMEADHGHAITAIREGHRLEAVQLNSQIEELKAQLAAKNARPTGDELEDGCAQMLIAIAHFSGIIRNDDMFQQLGLNKVQGDYWLDQLRKRKFIDFGLIASSDGCAISATAAGRDYLAKNGLLHSKPARQLMERPRNSRYGGGMF